MIPVVELVDFNTVKCTTYTYGYHAERRNAEIFTPSIFRKQLGLPIKTGSSAFWAGTDHVRYFHRGFSYKLEPFLRIDLCFVVFTRGSAGWRDSTPCRPRAYLARDGRATEQKHRSLILRSPAAVGGAGEAQGGEDKRRRDGLRDVRSETRTCTQE